MSIWIDDCIYHEQEDECAPFQLLKKQLAEANQRNADNEGLIITQSEELDEARAELAKFETEIVADDFECDCCGTLRVDAAKWQYRALQMREQLSDARAQIDDTHRAWESKLSEADRTWYAKLEAADSELAHARSDLTDINLEHDELVADIADARAELATAQVAFRNTFEILEGTNEVLAKERAQLAEARAEIERLRVELGIACLNGYVRASG